MTSVSGAVNAGAASDCAQAGRGHTRLDLLDAILPHCEPDKACLQNAEGQFAWLYTATQVTSAVTAWREGRLPAKCFETNKKGDTRAFMFDRPVRLGLVPHRAGKVGVFMIDLDNHDGGKDTTGMLLGLERFFGRPAVVFRSKSGKGLHLVYRLGKAQPVRKFVKWAKAWNFNREGRPELFPKTHRLTQLWLPNEPNGSSGGDAYVSGDLERASLDELPPAPPAGLAAETLDFLMGFTEPGGRNDLLNKAAFALGQRGCAEADADALCRRAAALCGLESGETDKSFRSGFDAGRQSMPKASVGPKVSDLPAIQANARQLRDIVADARAAVRKANTGPSVFLRHGAMAHLAWRKGLPVVEPMDQDLVYGLLARTANWMRMNEEGEFTHVKPVREVGRDMLAYPDPTLPPLEAVVTSPVFGRTGELISEPGYHADDALWLHLPAGLDAGDIPERPTREDMTLARSFLVSELLGDFPFVAPSDLAHMLAAILLPFVRLMIDGCTPLHLVEAPAPGSGKGLLCKLISVIAAGEVCASRTLPEDEDEVRKAFTAQLATSPLLIVLDNADDDSSTSRRKRIDSTNLSSVLTADIWSDRLLGQSRIVTMPNRALWILTANNPRLSMEIARRCVRIRLDPRMDRPWLRESFRHPHIIDWAKGERSRLVRSALVLTRAWQAAGSPLSDSGLGSFERWSAVIGGILAAVGVEGFLGNQNELYETADAEGEMWRAFVAAWWDAFRDEAKKVSQLSDLCERNDLMTPVRGGGTLRSRQTRLGAALHKARDRVFGGLTITRVARSRHKGAKAWRLVAQDGHDCAGAETLSLLPDGDLGDLGSGQVPTSPSLSRNDLRPQWGPWGPLSTLRSSTPCVHERKDLKGNPPKVPNVPESDVTPCAPCAGTSGTLIPGGLQHPPRSPAAHVCGASRLPDHVSDWPQDLRDRFEERASVVQYEGNLSRDEAEAQAESEIRRVKEAERLAEAEARLASRKEKGA